MTLMLQALVVEGAIHEGEETYMYKTVIFKSGSGLVTGVNIIIVSYYVMTSQCGRSMVRGRL